MYDHNFWTSHNALPVSLASRIFAFSAPAASGRTQHRWSFIPRIDAFGAPCAWCTHDAPTELNTTATVLHSTYWEGYMPCPNLNMPQPWPRDAWWSPSSLDLASNHQRVRMKSTAFIVFIQLFSRVQVPDTESLTIQCANMQPSVVWAQIMFFTVEISTPRRRLLTASAALIKSLTSTFSSAIFQMHPLPDPGNLRIFQARHIQSCRNLHHKIIQN